MTVQRNSFLQNLCLLSCCVCAQCLSVRSASPGDNVTVHCGLTVPRIHWFRQRPGQLPLFILHSLSATHTDAKYLNGSGDHYSLEAHNRLLIWNVTAEDSGTYYCAKRENHTLVFHTGTVLSVTDPDGSTTTVPPPDSATKSQNQPETWKTTLMTVSLVCNVMFLIAIAGCRLRPRQRPQTDEGDQRDSKGGSEAVGAEGHYQELSHRDTAVYEVCETGRPHRRH
ncbi:uncharacterized protein LOC136750788 [Amia ocellicauda]|uniref:uncharacterized protein LOC136750788 n=1 Tax=Amia ocellicauda TaxID=2972642 RepID=UPI003464DEEB